MSSFAAGMIYVMLSRVQCIDQLQIIDEFDPEKIKVDESVKAERSATADFPLRKKINNMGLKDWILPKNHFKTFSLLN